MPEDFLINKLDNQGFDFMGFAHPTTPISDLLPILFADIVQGRRMYAVLPSGSRQDAQMYVLMRGSEDSIRSTREPVSWKANKWRVSNVSSGLRPELYIANFCYELQEQPSLTRALLPVRLIAPPNILDDFSHLQHIAYESRQPGDDSNSRTMPKISSQEFAPATWNGFTQT